MTFLKDSRGSFFNDKRVCSICNNFIKINEEYDFRRLRYTSTKIYYCEKCIREGKTLEL